MPRQSRLSPDDLLEVKRLYADGMSREAIAAVLSTRGISIHPTTLYYHLGLGKKKHRVKSYLDYLREDCARRGVPFKNPRSRGMWS